jgi:segregation and condensation protein A
LTEHSDPNLEENQVNTESAAQEAPETQDTEAAFQGGPETWNLDALPPELDYFRNSEAYQVELSGFQGPMDLLLYLINKEQVDIYDIPIARITDQFIKHIEVMQAISLDTAGEFIAMAATLMVIKMKMLMPSHHEEDEDEEDPRAELVRKLLEYKRFKEAAEALQKAEADRRQYHLRQTKFPFTEDLDLEPKLRIEMYDLLAALAGIYDRIQAKPVHEVEREPYTVEEKMSLIEEKIGGGHMVNFTELFEDITLKMEVIVTFIAILELVKRGRLEFMQTESRGAIWIQRPGIDDEEDAGEPDHQYEVLDEDHAEDEPDLVDSDAYEDPTERENEN